MSTNKPVPRFTIDPAELQARKDVHTKFYNADATSEFIPRPAATVTFECRILAEAFVLFHDKLNAGWTVPEHLVDFTTVFNTGMTLVSLTKPFEVRQKELEAIHAEVEQMYIAELQTARTAEIDRVIEQQVQAQHRKEFATQTAKDEKERQRIRDEVSAAISGDAQ